MYFSHFIYKNNSFWSIYCFCLSFSSTGLFLDIDIYFLYSWFHYFMTFYIYVPFFSFCLLIAFSQTNSFFCYCFFDFSFIFFGIVDPLLFSTSNHRISRPCYDENDDGDKFFVLIFVPHSVVIRVSFYIFWPYIYIFKWIQKHRKILFINIYIYSAFIKLFF